jgi:hypothetical protein
VREHYNLDSPNVMRTMASSSPKTLLIKGVGLNVGVGGGGGGEDGSSSND